MLHLHRKLHHGFFFRTTRDDDCLYYIHIHAMYVFMYFVLFIQKITHFDFLVVVSFRLHVSFYIIFYAINS